MKPEIIDRKSHSSLAEGEEIIAYKFPWQFAVRFGVMVPDNKLPSPIAIGMSKSFVKFNSEMDINENLSPTS